MSTEGNIQYRGQVEYINHFHKVTFFSMVPRDPSLYALWNLCSTPYYQTSNESDFLLQKIKEMNWVQVMYRSSTLDFQYMMLLHTIKQEKVRYSLFLAILKTCLSDMTVLDTALKFWDLQRTAGSFVLHIIKSGTLLFKQEQFPYVFTCVCFSQLLWIHQRLGKICTINTVFCQPETCICFWTFLLGNV
jgi:hypothetical protein